MTNIINYTRLTSSEKQADRFVTCQVYEPLDIEQKELGSVFSHIEILNPWFPNSQIGQTIINTLIREYYRGANTSELINFENAIKKVNETLAQIAQSGETDWIGKTNGVLILINGKEMHLAQTGTSQAYLYRGTKINHITEGLGNQEKPHPLKTFSNLISGTLQEGDKIVVANNAFYEMISASELKNIINSFPPAITAIESAKILRKNNATNSNAMFFDITTKDALANLPKEQKVDTVYLDQTSFNPLSSIGSLLSSFFIPSAKKIADRSSKAFSKGKEKLSPKIKESFKVTGAWTKKKISNMSKLTNNREDPVLENGEVAREQTHSHVSKYQRAFIKIKNKIKRFFIQFGISPKINQKLILRVALILICIIAITIVIAVISKIGNKKNNELFSKVSQISVIYDKAVTEMENNPQNSLQLFESVIITAKDIDGTKYEAQAEEKAKLAQEKIDKLTQTSTLQPKNTYTLHDIVASTYSKDKQLSVDSNGNIFTRILSIKDFSKEATSKVKPPISNIIFISEEGQVAVISQNQEIEIFENTSLGKSSVFTLNHQGLVKEYLGSLYVLDSKNNQIYKYSQENNKLQEPTNYLKEQANVTKSVDLAIDGSVYTLEQDSKIQRLSRGKAIDEIQIKLPQNQTVKSAKKIFTDEDSDSLFIADITDKIKIIEISKSGEFKSQYSLSGADAQGNISISASQRKCLISSKDSILEFQF